MTRIHFIARASLIGLIASGLAFAVAPVAAAPAKAKARPKTSRPASAPKVTVSRPAPGAYKPSGEMPLSVGRGQLINLSAPITDVFVSNEAVADVQVRSPTQIYVFGKAAGEASVYATTASGAVAYSTNVRVGANINSLDQMLKLAMPDASVMATSMNGMILLTGTVKAPQDSEEAERLVQAYVGDSTKVISRLRTATPLQVNLHVKIAEVNRSLSKEIGVNLMSRDTTNGFQFGIAQGRNFGTIGKADISALPRLDASSVFGLPAGSLSLPFDTRTGQFVTAGTAFNLTNLGLGAGKTAIGLAGKLFGLDVASALDLAETEGLLTTLAEPNLTALSGETASFLAGGEFPIPISQGQGEVTVEYKQYGVSLAFTPVVLDNGRISMRVRPEVSELTSQGTVRLNGFDIPGVSTRRAETTVELGSGQSFMIAGLMNNTHSNIIDRTPGAGNVPVLGALFRSTRFRKNETELMIIVTPYLVEPVSANQIVLPTDGYKAATDLQRVLLGKTMGSDNGPRPVPTMEPSARAIRPGLEGVMAPVAEPTTRRAQRQQSRRSSKPNKVAVAPGFSAN
jgi:pilus assembly protein CpaC